MKFKKIEFMLFLLLLIFILRFLPIKIGSSFNSYPNIDGILEENEWDDGDRRILTLADGTIMVTTVIFNETDILFLLEVEDDNPTLYSQGESSWDGFGIEFDNNGDQIPMGLASSPDDAILISYRRLEAVDFVLQGIGNPAMPDTSLNGSEEVYGLPSINGNKIVAEVSKKLNSDDSFGSDFVFTSRKICNILYAYWDNTIYPETGISQTTSHSDWIQYEIPGIAHKMDSLEEQLLLELGLCFFFIVISSYIRFKSHSSN